jgi:hypothetical protein
MFISFFVDAQSNVTFYTATVAFYTATKFHKKHLKERKGDGMDND